MSQGKVWVAYAGLDAQFHVPLDFVEGMTAKQAIAQSQLASKTQLPEPLMIGIFGQKVDLEQLLQVGDRVEIYRALTINPKDIRRKRAAQDPVGIYGRGNRHK